MVSIGDWSKVGSHKSFWRKDYTKSGEMWVIPISALQQSVELFFREVEVDCRSKSADMVDDQL